MFHGSQGINFFLNFLFKSQQVASKEWQLIPNKKTPLRLTQLPHMIPLKDWIKIQDVIYSTLQYPLVPRTLGAPTMQQVFSQDKHIAHSSSQDP